MSPPTAREGLLLALQTEAKGLQSRLLFTEVPPLELSRLEARLRAVLDDAAAVRQAIAAEAADGVLGL